MGQFLAVNNYEDIYENIQLIHDYPAVSHSIINMCNAHNENVLRYIKYRNKHKLECSICLTDNNINSSITTLCGHSYHKKCIMPWVEIYGTCPVCRSNICK